MSDVQAPAGRFGPTLIAGCAGVMVAQVAYSLPASLLGTIQQQFGISGADLTWVSAVFATAMVIFELTFGVVGDRIGRKQLLLGGLALVIVGELISFPAHGVHQLWVGQAIAGIGAGALYPISLTMIAATAPSAQARARAIALWAGFLSIGAAVSPLAAGALASGGHWRGAFWVVIAVASVALMLAVPASNSSSPEGRGLDLPGQITLVIGLVSLIWALTQGSAVGYGKTSIVVGFVIAAAMLAAFVVIELRSAFPLVHLSLFKNRAFAVCGIVAVVGMFSYLGSCFSMSIFLGAIIHISAVKIGVLFVITQIPALLLVPLVARLIHTVRPQYVLTIGFLFLTAGPFWASHFDAHTTTWTAFIGPQLLVGVGFALTVASITAVAIGTVPLRLAGMASATTNLLRDFGFALGPVVIAAITYPIANHKFLGNLNAAIGASGLTDPAAIGTVQGISHGGGAIAINSLPIIPGNGPGARPLGPMPLAIHDAAFTQLSHAYNTAFVICALCALVSALLTFGGLFGRAQEPLDEEIADPVWEPAGVPADVH